MLMLKMDIECGKLDCLKACCDPACLTAVWRTMRNISEADLPLLSKMLCGCAVTPSKQLPATGFAQPNSTIAPINCTDKLTAWACEPTTSAVLTAISAGVAGAAIFAKVSPAIAITLSTLSLVVDDLISGCNEISQGHAHNWSDTLVDKLCALNGWLDAMIKKAPTALQPILELMKTIQTQFTFLNVVGQWCCQQRTVGITLPDPNTISDAPTPGTNQPNPGGVPTVTNPPETVETLTGPSVPSGGVINKYYTPPNPYKR